VTIEEALRSSGIEPREARLLLARVTDLSEAGVLAFPERALSGEHAQRFTAFVERRKRGEPVAYILGEKEFYGLRLSVTPAVLIPRPETELLVELALRRKFESALDLGTGSGAIALAIKHERPGVRVVGVDSSAAALAVANRNGAALGLHVDWRQGRWFEPVEGERFDLVLANPPYIAAGDAHLAALRFEPLSALVAGADGLDAVREIITAASGYLERGGWLLVEHGKGQDAAVRSVMQAGGLEEVQTWPDLSGIGRVSGGRA
jgi:release factor glutamine methyltransferase